MKVRRILLILTTVATALAAGVAWGSSNGHAVDASANVSEFPTPVQHVVVIDQENHSFDNVLGKLCVVDARCDGATSGLTLSGATIPLAAATDAVPWMSHDVTAQRHALHRGAMDGWEHVRGCEADECYVQYDPNQIPSTAALARSGVIADRYFSDGNAPSFGSHLFFTNQTLDGFDGNNPQYIDKSVARGPGWGCDSNLEGLWQGQWEPSCIPFADGSGAFKPTPVPHTDTLMDRLDGAGRTWRIYASPAPKPKPGGQGASVNGYSWNPCSYNADCLYTSQAHNSVRASRIIDDASSGNLPNFSLVVPNGPTGHTSQHNGTSMLLGDNWIGSVVSAIENGPDADSTTIFVTWDDCGCFYDHVRPPQGYGIRLPLVIVGRYAKPGYTESRFASSSSILAYTEHVLTVPPLIEDGADGTAYDFADSFDYSQPPPATKFVYHPGVESRRTKQLLERYAHDHPDADDDET